MTAPPRNANPLLTIGELARRARLRPSALRYYEAQGLLLPAKRTGSGYRLYEPESEDRLRFIQRAQRLGFSLDDIRRLLLAPGAVVSDTPAALAEARLLEIERSLTHLLVQRHEMEHFLREAARNHPEAGQVFQRLIDRVCVTDEHGQPTAESTLGWLIERSGCLLSTPSARTILSALRGVHVHIWQEADDAYYILVVGHDEQIRGALEALIEIEQSCEAGPYPALEPHPEGYGIIARGDTAFFYAQLFLALERDENPLQE
ncbi:MAG: MerR family transcriptional regulator [Anaerolineae bacterium]|nr:MerR family transcriptional regulator [Anaerolineae bacterium]